MVTTKHELNSALIGMILFDGSMINDHCLYIRHGYKQLDYVDEKVKYISKYLLSNFDMVIANVQSSNSNSINMCLRSGFKELRKVDYSDTLGNSTKNILLYLR